VRMNEKTDVQVIINGKQYTICGYESSDYLQHIANHINEKFDEFKRQEAYNRLDMDMKNILLAICPMIILRHRSRRTRTDSSRARSSRKCSA